MFSRTRTLTVCRSIMSPRTGGGKHEKRSRLCTIYVQCAHSSVKPIYTDAAEATKDIPDGAKIMIGGFGLCGMPENLINGLIKSGQKELFVVSSNAGTSNHGLGPLLKHNMIRRIMCSYMGENPEAEGQYLRGDVEVEFTPQGTLAERIRAGGSGIPAFYTPAGYGTVVQKGGNPIKKRTGGAVDIVSQPREEKIFNGIHYIMEESITADYAFVKAWKADKMGNVIYKETARNFNPIMARAAKCTIVEVEEVVEIGDLDPNFVHTPAVFVDRVVLPKDIVKPIEKIVHRGKDAMNESTEMSDMDRIRTTVARRAALEVENGMTINLGIGMPMLVPTFLPRNIDCMLQSENGIVGLGPYPLPGQESADLINAGKETVTAVPGAAYIDSSDVFAMIRGGHLAITMLGSMQVSQFGDISNWMIPVGLRVTTHLDLIRAIIKHKGKKVKGMGGAMDLVSAPGIRVIVTMQHASKNGEPKILDECTLPLTGLKCVDMIITELAVFKCDRKLGLKLIEVAKGHSVEDVIKVTGCDFRVSRDLKPMQQAPWPEQN